MARFKAAVFRLFYLGHSVQRLRLPGCHALELQHRLLNLIQGMFRARECHPRNLEWLWTLSFNVL